MLFLLFIILFKATGFHIVAAVNWQVDNWAYACDFKNNDLTSSSMPLEQCGLTCVKTPDCTHFSWTPWQGGTCWMKKGPISKSDAYDTYDQNMVCGIVDRTLVVSPTATENPQPEPDTDFSFDEELDMFFIGNHSEKKMNTSNYVNYVKGLLFSAKNFTLTPVPLPCTDMDPNKDNGIAYQNKFIAICDVFPNFPFDKFSGVYIDQEAYQFVERESYLGCINLCLNLTTCMALSYDANESICYMYNSTDGNFVTVKDVTTIAFNQPKITIRDWITYRNTKAISTNSNSSSVQADNFLDCLYICDKSTTCSVVTYEFSTKFCKLFSSSQFTSLDYAYGSVTALHSNDLHPNESDQWRFTEYTENENDEAAYDMLKNGTKKEFGMIENQGCLIQQLPGCELVGQNNQPSTNQKCFYPENSKTNLNLPICTDSIYKLIEKTQKYRPGLEACFTDCTNDVYCIAVDFYETYGYCAKLNFENAAKDWNLKDKRRFILKNPKQRDRIEFKFTAYPKLAITSQAKHIVNILNINDCLKACYRSNECERVSFDFQKKICYHGSNEALLTSNDKSIAYLKSSEVNSIMFTFDRLIQRRANGKHLGTRDMPCQNNRCDSNLISDCLKLCETNVACELVSISYDYPIMKCGIFATNETTIVESTNSEIFIRRLPKSTLAQSDFDNLNFFVNEDLYYYWTQQIGQSQSTLQEYQDYIIENEFSTFKRMKPRFWGAIGNFFKGVGNFVVDTVKTVVETPIKLVESTVKVFQGDFKGALDKVREIDIVKNVESTVESAIKVGKNIVNGEWSELGSSLLDLAVDGIGLVPLPSGKAIGQASKVIKNQFKKDTKEQIGKSTKPLKTEKPKEKPKNCKNKRFYAHERYTVSRAKRPNNLCDDDDDGDNFCYVKIVKNINGKESDCNKKKKPGAQCSLVCQRGYHESALIPKCIENPSPVSWRPKLQCELESCGSFSMGYYKFPVDLKARLASAISVDMNLYYVVFDSIRKLPIYIASYIDLTSYAKIMNRVNGFTVHPCAELNGKQAKNDDFKMTPAQLQQCNPISNSRAWDKGHLAPNALFTFNKKAALISNFFVNIAPQDPYTNQKPWQNLEMHVSCFLKKRGGLVITGVSPASIGSTQSGLDVPSFFWKLVCYKDNSQTIVVGFIGDNSIVSWRSEQQKDGRKDSVQRLLSQREVLGRLGTKYSLLYTTMWFDAKTTLKGRKPMLPLNPLECASAQQLPANLQSTWSSGNGKRQSSLKFGCTPNEFNEFKSLFGGLYTYNENDNDDADDDDTDIEDDYDESDYDSNNLSRFKSSKCGKRLIGYYPSWGNTRFSAAQGNALTHAVFAFFETFSDGTVRIGSAESQKSENPEEEKTTAIRRLANFVRICSAFPHLKCMFAVGGWENSQYFSDIAANPNKRIRFISSVIEIIDEYDLDGVDVDWEYPVTGGAVEGTPNDKSNYVVFMKEIRDALDQHAKNKGRNEKFLLSFAGAAGQWTLDPGYDLKGLLKYADWANVMTYDYFGPWSSKWGAYTGSPSPLYFGNPKGFSGKVNADWSMKYYVCRSREPHKINMGVPFYGRYWKNVGDPIDPNDGMWRIANAVNGKFEGGFEQWKTIRSKWLGNPDNKVTMHEKSKTPYIFNDKEKTFLGFENPESLKYKVEYAEEHNLGGLMIWAIDQDDDDNTMMSVVNKADLCKITDPSKIVHKCPPIEEKRWWTPEDGYDKAGMCGKSAPLYQGYYPVCDPDDPGYSCCGSQGYCGSGPESCDCPTCVDYLKYPEKILKEPIKPSTEVRWYFLNDADGKRGRCGRTIPFINGKAPICNPDDENAYCCSNGGYCGNTKAHCECDGCVNLKANPNYEFKPKKWWSYEDGPDKAGRCGPSAPLYDGKMAECNPDDANYYCCSKWGNCGSGADFCDCDGCINYKKVF